MPAEPGSPTITRARMVTCPESYGARAACQGVHRIGRIGWPVLLASRRCPGVQSSVPGELDHATGSVESHNREPERADRSPPRSDESRVPALWIAGRGCREVVTLVCCGSRPLGK